MNVCARLKAFLSSPRHLSRISFMQGTGVLKINYMELSAFVGRGESRSDLRVKFLQECRKEVSHWMLQSRCKSACSWVSEMRPGRGQNMSGYRRGRRLEKETGRGEYV